jgi:hypothetical protein
MVWNFGVGNLFWMVPLVFAFVRLIDLTVDRWVHSPDVRWYLHTTLFFYFIYFGSLVNSSTFILWTVLVGKSIDLLLPLLPRAERLAFRAAR